MPYFKWLDQLPSASTHKLLRTTAYPLSLAFLDIMSLLNFLPRPVHPYNADLQSMEMFSGLTAIRDGDLFEDLRWRIHDVHWANEPTCPDPHQMV